MGHPNRPLPVRTDLWQPHDTILDTVIGRCLDDAESDESSAGGSTLMGGALVLTVLGVAILALGGPPAAAVLIPVALGGAGLAYMVTRSSSDRGTRHDALVVVGGAGRLPAGYLVHPGAWEAGMAEHVAYLPESQLQASVQMCRNFPGTVDDLITFTGSIAVHVPAVQHATPADVERRTRDLVKIGAPILRNYLTSNPAQPLPAPAGKKGGGRNGGGKKGSEKGKAKK
jgi:hypothetical protein